mmetsp:Transcript_44547/g.104453  ORF Transcript_44547/g.104453 Transcript_44547/m.104453 type:complete len:93 (-) Transcript_44547:24-302(-)
MGTTSPWSRLCHEAEEVHAADIAAELYAAGLHRLPAGGQAAQNQMVVDQIIARFELAWVAHQHLAIDESMDKCLSKYCPFLQYLPRKPEWLS